MSKSMMSLTAFFTLIVFTTFQPAIEAFGPSRATANRQQTAASIMTQVQQSPYAIVKLSASWCQPCHALTPMLSQAVTALNTETRKSIRVIEVDVDQNKDFVSQYRFNSVPTLLFFQGGTLKGQESGTPQTVQDLKTLIKRNLAL